MKEEQRSLGLSRSKRWEMLKKQGNPESILQLGLNVQMVNNPEGTLIAIDRMSGISNSVHIVRFNAQVIIIN